MPALFFFHISFFLFSLIFISLLLLFWSSSLSTSLTACFFTVSLIFRDSVSLPLTPPYFLTVLFCHPSLFFSHSHRKTSGSDSPDSLLKKSLLPASSHYPTTSSTTTYSSLQTDSSPFSSENHHRRQQLMYNYNRGRSSKAASLISTQIELISRGPDGRFMLPPYDNDTLSFGSKENVRYDQKARRSVSLHSEREDRKQQPFVLSVEFPPCKLEDDSTSQMFDMDQVLPHHTPHVVDEKGSIDGFPDISSLCSNSTHTTMRHHNREVTPIFPVLPHIKSGFGQPSTTASSLVLQMEHEREKGNLSHCLKLAQEREQLEMELQKYMLQRNSLRDDKRQQVDIVRKEDRGEELLWEYKTRTLPCGYSQGIKESHFSSSNVHRESHPFVSQPTLIPSRNHLSTSSPSTPSCFKSGCHPSPSYFQSEEAGNFSKDRLSLPHLSSKHQGHERAKSPAGDHDHSKQSTIFNIKINDSCFEGRRQNHLSHGSFPSSSFQYSKYQERHQSNLDEEPDFSRFEMALHKSTGEDMSVEMSVDEPEVFMTQPKKPMLHHRIASHVKHGCSLTHKQQLEDTKRSTSFNCHSPASMDNINGVLHYLQPSEQEHWRAVRKGSNMWNPKQRSHSLDLRGLKKKNFLTPDAWVDSLNQENCSVASSCQPDSLFWIPQRSLNRKVSEHPGNPMPPNSALPHSPAVDHLSPVTRPQRPLSNPQVPCLYKPKGHMPFPTSAATNSETDYIDSFKEVSTYLPAENNDLETLEVEAGDELGGSYSSYASSGRGSMETANGRLSLCQLSPTLISPPETIEDTQGRSVDQCSTQVEPSQRY